MRIDVVHNNAIQANGGHQTRVLRYPSEVIQNRAIFEEDRWSRVASLDRPIQVIPLIHPADRSAGAAGVGLGAGLILRQQHQELKDTVECTSFILADNQYMR